MQPPVLAPSLLPHYIDNGDWWYQCPRCGSNTWGYFDVSDPGGTGRGNGYLLVGTCLDCDYVVDDWHGANGPENEVGECRLTRMGDRQSW